MAATAHASEHVVRLRGGYMGQSSTKVLEPMARAGMNTAIVKFGNATSPLGGKDVADLAALAAECEHEALSLMPVINWWGSAEPHFLPTYQHFITSTGATLPKTPCPYDAEFWERDVTSRLLALVGAVRSAALKAVCVDAEMYGADVLAYDGDCFCDRCFARWLASRSRRTPLPAPADRARIVTAAGELDAYREVERETARRLAAACREPLGKARPGVRLGVLNADLANPFYEGLAQGLGTEQSPLLCFTEQTYNDGYSPLINATQSRYRSLGADVDLVAGIFQSKWAAEQLAEQLYYCAKSTAGYWIFTMETFLNPSYMPLPGLPRGYWEAIEKADQELDRLTANPSYASDLSLRPKVAAGPAVLWSEAPQYNVLRPASGAAGNLPSLWLRRANRVYFWARKGEAVSFELTWRQLGKYEDVASVGAVSPRGEPLASATARPNAPAEVRFSAAEDGLYGLALQAGMNAVEITRASHPFSVQAPASGDGAFLTVKVPPLFLPIVQGSARAVLELTTPVSAQAVKVTVSEENGSHRWSGVVDGTAHVIIDDPHGAYLRIDTEKLPNKALQDVHVKAIEGVLPLAALEPGWLLRPAR